MDLLPFRADKSVSKGITEERVPKNEGRSVGLTLLDELGVNPCANGRDEHRTRGPGRLEKQIEREPGTDHCGVREDPDRKSSTRLNSSHEWISYAVFCLK